MKQFKIKNLLSSNRLIAERPVVGPPKKAFFFLFFFFGVFLFIPSLAQANYYASRVVSVMSPRLTGETLRM